MLEFRNELSYYFQLINYLAPINYNKSDLTGMEDIAYLTGPGFLQRHGNKMGSFSYSFQKYFIKGSFFSHQFLEEKNQFISLHPLLSE